MSHVLEYRREQQFEELQEKAGGMGATLLTTPEGFRIVPVKDGQPFQPQQIPALSEEEQAGWKETRHTLEHELNEAG